MKIANIEPLREEDGWVEEGCKYLQSFLQKVKKITVLKNPENTQFLAELHFKEPDDGTMESVEKYMIAAHHGKYARSSEATSMPEQNSLIQKKSISENLEEKGIGDVHVKKDKEEVKELKVKEESGFKKIIENSPSDRYKSSVYLTNFPKDIDLTDYDIEKYMRTYGPVRYVKVSTNMQRNKYARVDFQSEQGRTATMAEKSHKIRGRAICVRNYGDRSSEMTSSKEGMLLPDNKEEINIQSDPMMPDNRGELCDSSKLNIQIDPLSSILLDGELPICDISRASLL